MYSKNTTSSIDTLEHKLDKLLALEHKLDKLLALSNSPANQLPDRLVLPEPIAMKLVSDVYENDDIILSEDAEVMVSALYLDKTYNSGVACETDKGLLDMGLLIN